MQAFPQVLTVLCAPSSTPSVSSSSFSSAAGLFSLCGGFIISPFSTYHLFAALPFLSRRLSVILSSFPCTERLLHCQASSFLHPRRYFRTVKRLQTCTRSLFKHAKAKDRNKRRLRLLRSFTPKAPYRALLFSIFRHVLLSQRKAGLAG